MTVFCSMILVLNMSCYSQKLIEVDVDMKGYEEEATSFIKERYQYSKKLLKKDKVIFIDSLDLVSTHYNFDELKIYSAPIFSLKNDIEYSCEKNFVDYIDFSDNFSRQNIYVEAKDSLVCITQLSKGKNSEESPLDIFSKALLIHKDVPIMGSNINLYSYKEKLYKKYFTFNIEGLMGDFVFKDDKVFFVQMIDENTPDSNDRFTEKLSRITPRFVEVNEYVHKFFGPRLINDIIGVNSSGSDKFCRDKKHKKIEYKVIMKNY